MKRKVHTMIVGMLCAVIAASAGAGLTQAFLTETSTPIVNHINIATDGINAVLLEPTWDGIIDFAYINGTMCPVYEYRDDPSDEKDDSVPVYGYEDGDYAKPVFRESSSSVWKKPVTDSNDDTKVFTYGIESSRNMIPGDTALKNPYIKNTSEQEEEWSAIKITFVYAGQDGKNVQNKGKPLSVIDMLNVSDYIEIDYNCDIDTDQEPGLASKKRWERIDLNPDDDINASASDVSQVFYYSTPIAAGDATIPIFTKVKLKDTVTSKQIKTLQDMGGFVIHVEGFVVQAKNFTQDYQTFKEWGLDGGVVFTYTPTDKAPLEFDENGIIQ